MRLTTLVLYFASLVYSQSISDLPSCASSCLGTSLTATGCALTDVKCICASNLIASITPCVTGACTTAELDSTIVYAQNLCLAAGVTISVPASASTAASGASGSGSAAVASGTSASGAGTSPNTTSASATTTDSTTTAAGTTVTGAKTTTATTSAAAASTAHKISGSVLLGTLLTLTVAIAGLGTAIII